MLLLLLLLLLLQWRGPGPFLVEKPAWRLHKPRIGCATGLACVQPGQRARRQGAPPRLVIGEEPCPETVCSRPWSVRVLR